MFEDYISFMRSIWASVNSWFTPTVLFLFLNLMIGTIVILSSFATPKHHQQRHGSEQYTSLVRSPSFLHKLKSFNFSSSVEKIAESETHLVSKQIYDQELPQLARSPSLMERLRSFNPCNYINHESSSAPEIQSHLSKEEGEQAPEEDQRKTLDEIFSLLDGRTDSDTDPSSGTIPTKLNGKMKKSASSKSSTAHFKGEDIPEARRPATVRELKPLEAEVDDEVDAKADDFINKFKQQLKLQRLDSIVRYKEIVNRRTGK